MLLEIIMEILLLLIQYIAFVARLQGHPNYFVTLLSMRAQGGGDQLRCILIMLHSF